MSYSIKGVALLAAGAVIGSTFATRQANADMIATQTETNATVTYDYVPDASTSSAWNGFTSSNVPAPTSSYLQSSLLYHAANTTNGLGNSLTSPYNITSPGYGGNLISAGAANGSGTTEL